MKSFFLYCLFVGIVCNLWGQATQVWDVSYGGSDATYGSKIELDSLGFVYSLGFVWGTLASPLPPALFPGPAFYVAKLDNLGNLAGSHKVAVNQNQFYWAGDHGHPGMAVDPTGNLYITGGFSDSVDVDPDSTTQWLFAQGEDILTYKLNANGSLKWARQMGGVGDERGYQIDVDSKGNVYVLGTFQDSLDADPGANAFWLYHSGNPAVFLQKLDSSGNFLWAKVFAGSSGSMTTHALEISATDELYLTGSFLDSIDFDPGPNTFYLDAGNVRDMYVMKLGGSGNLLWAKAVGGAQGSLISNDLAVDLNGNVVTIGTMFIDSIDFDPGPIEELLTFPLGPMYGHPFVIRSVFLQKLDASGNFLWVKQFIGGDPDEDQSQANGEGVTIDACGQIYATGYALWSTVASPEGEEGGGDFPESHNFDMFLLKLEEDGSLLWIQDVGVQGSGQEDVGYDVRVNQDRKICTTGSLGSYGSLETWSTNQFLQSPDTVVIDSLLTVSACQSYLSPSGNYLWDSSGVYFDTLRACNNTAIQVSLTIGQTSDTTIKLGECAPFDLNGYTYHTPGSYTQIIPNALGCDSVITLDLAILSSSDSSFAAISCGNYQLNAENYTSSGTYVQNFSNSIGCDSVLTLDLTIIPASQASLTDTACGSYVLNGETFTTGGTFSQLLTNEAGCDSILTLNLTLLDSLNLGISQSGTILSALATGVSYQWLDCEQNFAPIPGETSQQLQTSGLGSYAVILSNGLCSDTSACLSFSVGLDGSFPTAWQLFPSPSQGLLHLKFDQVYEQVSVRVFTVLGQAISQQQVGSGSQEAVIVLPPQTGLYLIEVEADGRRGVAKVLRE